MNFDRKNNMFKTKFSLENWQSKYRHLNETPIETFIRVANNLAIPETETLEEFEAFKLSMVSDKIWINYGYKLKSSWAYKFLKTMVKFDESGFPIGLKLTPGGRITANAGTGLKNATYFNCFINGFVKNASISYNRSNFDNSFTNNINIQTPDNPDDLVNIFLTIMEFAKVLASGGGIGMDVSVIRPRGSIINGSKTLHPGVVSYLEVFDEVSNCIVKGNNDGYVDKLKNYYKDEEYEKLVKSLKTMRRGACIAVLRVDHPDIEEFVRAKQTAGKLTKFNLSVGIIPGFMDAVLNDQNWELKFNGKISKIVKARELYDLIMESNYNRAEPGVLFLDNAEKNNPIQYIGSPNACNPCVAKGTLVKIRNGWKPVEELKVGDEIATISGFGNIKTIETHQNLPVFKVKFSRGSEIVVTTGHIFHSQETYNVNNDWCINKPLSELKVGNTVRLNTFKHDESKVFACAMITKYGWTVITSIEPFGNSDVYDIYEESTDTWITKGEIVNRGCGEIVAYDGLTTVCLLGSLNLTQYVKIVNFKPYFDFESFMLDIPLSIRMLDNVCDLSNTPLQGFQYFVNNFRQIALGINGLGSTLLMLGIPYNSQEALDFIKTLAIFKENECWKASAFLAREKGCFKAYDAEKFQNTEFFKSDRLYDDTKELIKILGVRNAKISTIPPLGNSSLISDYTSNGLEPIYSVDVSRKYIIKDWPEGLNNENIYKLFKPRKIGDIEIWEGVYNGENYYYEPHNRGLCKITVLRDYGFQWLLDNFPEQIIDNPALVSVLPPNIKDIETTINLTLDSDLKFSENYNIQNLSVNDHLNVLEILQYYNSQSCSKTINIPKDYNFEDFKNVYIDAWKRGIIGVTTYREGTMESVIESTEKKVEPKVISKDLKLPEIFVNGDTKIIKKENMKFYIHFSYLPDDKKLENPIGIWITTNHKNEIKLANKACKKLIELATFFEIDQDIIENAWEKCIGDSAHNRIARMIGLCLRHNIPRQEILVALTGIEGDNLSTLLSAIRKFIAETIPDGVKLKKVTCPQCKDDEIIMQSGCYVCTSCGYSGCS